MRRVEKSIVFFTLIYILTNNTLLLMGESRPDVYLLVFLAIYFIYYSLEPVFRNNNGLRKINAILVSVLVILAVYRIYSLLFGV